ncbi:MAG: outer membrane lipoprotein-sorting protein [Verrucomicrobium sp.]|nr:outer membrane lipoprotein-sorting protein [Verrucomicrobium sp.]
MKLVPLMIALLGSAVVPFAVAADAAPVAGLTAADLAAKLSAQQQDGSTLIRAKLDVKTAAGEAKTVLQLQIKSRRTPGQTDVVYQVLWPKERKGESVLVRSSGSGAVYVPPDKTTSLEASSLKDALFASDLSYEDVTENFFAWKDQTLVGTEVVDGANCQILESKPKGARSSYAKVRSWIDTKRMIPLRVEKYSAANQLVRRVDTTDVANVDGRYLPANLAVRRPGQDTVTVVDGSRIKRGVSYTDADFTAEGIKNLSAPRGGD